MNPTFKGAKLSTVDPLDHPISYAVVASTFNTYLGELFTSETFSAPLLPSFESPMGMQGIYLSVDGILNVIERLPLTSSPACDGINSRLLKITKTTSAKFLLLIIKQSVALSQLPSNWLNANEVSIFKSGNSNELNNYRPISLPSVLFKLLEHIVFSNTMSHLDGNNLFFLNQHGFRKNLS